MIRPLGINEYLYSLTQEAILLEKLLRPRNYGLNTITPKTMANLMS